MAVVVLRTSSTDEHYNADCDLAFVELTPDLARAILKRIAVARSLHRTDSSLSEVRYWDSSAAFFHDGGRLEELLDARTGAPFYDSLDDGGIGVLAARPEIPEGSFQRTECDEMIVRDDAVAWVAIPKHCDLYITTTEIPVKMLKRAASRKASRRARCG